MKVIYSTILVLIFSFTIFSQTNETDCQKIIIKSPDYVYTKTTFEVSATYKKTTSSKTSRFNWTIINQDKVTKISQKQLIEITSGDIKYGETNTIIVLVESLNEKCRDIEIVKIPFFQRVGSPLIIDVYGNLKWKDEKIRLDAAIIEITNPNNAELLIFVGYDDELLKKGVKKYLVKILNHLNSRGLSKDRVTFLTEYAKTKQTKLQPLPPELDARDFFTEYLIIKGEDLEKVAKMFK